MIDEIDKEILTILQRDARTSNAEIARNVGMAPSAILERIRKLEERGIIQSYTARLDARSIGVGLLAYVFVRTDDRSNDTQISQVLAMLPGVQEVHHIAGEDCYLMKIRTADTESLGRLLRLQVGSLASVRSTRTTIVLETIKETADLPI